MRKNKMETIKIIIIVLFLVALMIGFIIYLFREGKYITGAYSTIIAVAGLSVLLEKLTNYNIVRDLFYSSTLSLGVYTAPLFVYRTFSKKVITKKKALLITLIYGVIVLAGMETLFLLYSGNFFGGIPVLFFGLLNYYFLSKPKKAETK